MLSRVAESIYWMSRQVERAENLARFLEVTHNLSLDQSGAVVDAWTPLVEITADQKLFRERYPEANAETVTQFLAFDLEYPNSMLASLQMARENSRSVRESLSSEVFEQLNGFYHFVNNAAKQPTLESPSDFLNEVRRIAIQWTGVLESTMPRDLGWHFANVGRLLERADKTSRILDVKYFNLLPSYADVGTAVDDLQWSALLLAISAFEAYRREHHLVEIEKVVHYFLFHDQFPRSISFCIAGVHQSLGQIEFRSISDQPGVAHQRILKLNHRLGHTQVKEVMAGGMHQFIDSLQVELNEIGKALDLDYFHSPVTV
jgi:uncharacterized alpha-E superfamily protein